MRRRVGALTACCIGALAVGAASGVQAGSDGPPVTLAAARQATAISSPEVAAFRKAIRARYDLKEKAFASHDAATIVDKFYAADVISVGAGEGIFVGREQIRPLYEEVVKANLVRIDSVYSSVSGRSGWDWADFHVTPTDGKTAPFTFAILFLWTKIGDQWWCKGDFFVAGSLREGKLAPSAPR